MVVAFALGVLLAQPPESAAREIQRAHIEANVPVASQFDRILRRDLEAYFTRSREGGLTVDWELLRDGPTQSGMAYPKFYVWVRVQQSGVTVDQGAVRLAAIERTRFAVTHFLPERSIRGNPSTLDTVFPQQLCTKVKERLGLDEKTPER